MKRFSLRSDAIPRARRLRKEMTRQERKLWRALRESFPDAHFRSQVPLGPYIADFAWHTAKIAIEVDGGQHGTDAAIAHDGARTQFIEREGYRVLRFWNCDIDGNLEGVIRHISDFLAVVGNDEVGARRVRAAIDSSSPGTLNSFGAQTRAAPHQLAGRLAPGNPPTCAPPPQGGGELRSQ